MHGGLQLHQEREQRVSPGILNNQGQDLEVSHRDHLSEWEFWEVNIITPRLSQINLSISTSSHGKQAITHVR